MEWNNGQMNVRDEPIRRIRRIGRKGWKQEVGYHRRSLAETAFYRLKQIFGNRVSARRFDAQANEVFIRLFALNRMTELGMPDTVVVWIQPLPRDQFVMPILCNNAEAIQRRWRRAGSMTPAPTPLQRYIDALNAGRPLNLYLRV